MQSLSQQTPSTQWPVEHSASIEHFVPGPLSGLQTPPRQKEVPPQSALVLQPVHCVFPQMPGAQSWVRTEGHDPEPLHASPSVAMFMVASHDGARHWALWPGTTQAVVSLPSQVPSQPVPSPMHATRGGMGLPLTGEHVPTLLGRLQASHCPTQSSLQHTPSTQNPSRHWLPEVQTAPAFALGVHFPPAAQ